MLEIPQLCACGTDHPFKVIQAALISSGLVSVEKCSFLPNPVLVNHLFLVWIGGRLTSVSSLTCTSHTTLLHILCSCCQLSDIDILLEAENIQVLCQHSHYVNVVDKKNYEGLRNSLDQNV